MLKIQNPKPAPEKTFFMPLTVDHLGNAIGFNTIELIQSKLASIHKTPSPTTKIELIGPLAQGTSILNLLTNFMLT